MKKITYSIEHNIVFKNVYDTELDLIVNFKGIYKGKTRKECEAWLEEYKKGLKQ
jgi:hypothetical protein